METLSPDKDTYVFVYTLFVSRYYQDNMPQFPHFFWLSSTPYLSMYYNLSKDWKGSHLNVSIEGLPSAAINHSFLLFFVFFTYFLFVSDFITFYCE